MTKTIEATNTYTLAIAERVAFEETNKSLTDNKKTKFTKYMRRVAHEKYSTILDAIAYDASFVNDTKIEGKKTDVYTVEKVTNYLSFALDSDSLKASCVAMLKTVVLCAQNNVTVYSDDFKTACSADQKIDAKRAKYISRNADTQSMSTILVQARSSYRALEALKILKSVSVSKQRQEFAIDTDNALYKLIAQRFA